MSARTAAFKAVVDAGLLGKSDGDGFEVGAIDELKRLCPHIIAQFQEHGTLATFEGALSHGTAPALQPPQSHGNAPARAGAPPRGGAGQRAAGGAGERGRC